jgi:hypothetical protein
MSSSFSRISYGVHDDADPEEIKAVLEKNGDGIVGVLFGKSVGEQIGSTWFWYVRPLSNVMDADEKGDGVYGSHSDVGISPPGRQFCSNQDDTLSYRTRINWYLATVNSQLVYYTGEQQLADNLTDGMSSSYDPFLQSC